MSNRLNVLSENPLTLEFPTSSLKFRHIVKTKKEALAAISDLLEDTYTKDWALFIYKQAKDSFVVAAFENNSDDNGVIKWVS